jgi:hypothetical protein
LRISEGSLDIKTGRPVSRILKHLKGDAMVESATSSNKISSGGGELCYKKLEYRKRHEHRKMRGKQNIQQSVLHYIHI